MKFHITTDRLVIIFDTDEKKIPASLTDELFIKEIDDYEPHHVEALLDRDPGIKAVTVYHKCKPDTNISTII